MNKRNFIATGASLAAVALLAAGCTTTGGASGDPAAQRQAIDAAADSALSRLYAQAGGSRELVASSRGMLVFPNFVSAGFVVGGARRLRLPPRPAPPALRRPATPAHYPQITSCGQ